MQDGKVIALETQNVGWTWVPPVPELPARQYAAALMRDAKRWSRNPDALAHYGRAGEIRPNYRYRDDGAKRTYVLDLVAWVGGGWGSTQRARVATWKGGKRWTIRDAARGACAEALRALQLPEADGRYLVIGAPPKPERGVMAWRNRWTIGRRNLYGVTVVAGAGIEDASVKARVSETLKNARVSLGFALTEQVNASEALAQLAETEADTLARCEQAQRAFRIVGIPSHGSTYGRNDSQRRDRLHARAATMLERYAAEDARPLAIGVRATRPDGTPLNGGGAYSAAHKLGLPATAPDWAPTASCGAGLHYVPAVRPSTEREPMLRDDATGAPIPRAAATCVQDALRYASGDYALWIVRAEVGEHAIDATPRALMIDGHKAKARTLTPLARVGHTGAGGKARSAIDSASTHAHQTRYSREALAQALRDQKRNARTIETLETTLREWRKT